MEDNNVVVAENEQPVNEQPVSNKPSFGAAVKEFFRKQIINLKRKPQNIGFIMIIITCAFNLLVLGTYSQGIQNTGAGNGVAWVGLMVFINTLFSLLIVVAYMNSFPKMKKPAKLVKDRKTGKTKLDENGNEIRKESKTVITIHFTKASKININILMAVLTVVFAIVMIICECYYRHIMIPFVSTTTGSGDKFEAALKCLEKANVYSLVHIILLAVDVVLFLLTPVIGKLLAKINTSKEIESAVSNMQEIDLASEE